MTTSPRLERYAALGRPTNSTQVKPKILAPLPRNASYSHDEVSVPGATPAASAAVFGVNSRLGIRVKLPGARQSEPQLDAKVSGRRAAGTQAARAYAVRSMDEVVLEQSLRRVRPLEYATGLTITGQNAPGYEAKHERLAHLPQITLSKDYGYNPGDDSKLVDGPGAFYKLQLQESACGDEYSEFVERRIREILQSEGVKASAAPPGPGAESNLVRKSSRKASVAVSLERMVSVARAVSVRMAVLRSYKQANPAGQAGHGYRRKMDLRLRLPNL